MWSFRWRNESLQHTFTERGHDLYDLQRELTKIVASGHTLVSGICPC
jgi:hypothetical protein